MNSLKAFVTTPTKRSYRRLLVILFYGLLALGGFLSTTRFDPGTTGGALLGGIFTVLLVHSTANIIFTPSNHLDERQQRVQSLTFRSAYLTLMGLAALYLFLLDGLELSWSPLPTARLLELDIISTFVILLPITIVAWTEPGSRRVTRLSTRRNRRVYITLYTLALVFLYPSLYENLGVFAFLVFLLLSPLYYSGSTIVAAYRKNRMDERERQMVLEGMTTAYTIFVGTLLASLVVATFEIPEWLAGLAPYFLLTQSVLFDPFTMTLLVLVLPACVIAWLEPDPPTEEARVMSAG